MLRRSGEFVLKSVLRGWNDKQSLMILRSIVKAMKSTDRLFIIDALVDQCDNKEMIMAVDLALLTIFGGKERTAKQFTLLLQEARQCELLKKYSKIRHRVINYI